MRLLVLVSSFAVVGCYSPLPTAPPNPDRAAFGSEIYPILVRDCGFPACHGSPDRFFRVFGPGRTRQFPDTPIPGPASGGGLDSAELPAEVDATYERARSMLAGAASASESLLVRKPLEVDQGGAPHFGTDAYGRDVFPDQEDSRYQAILRWADGAPP